jgi:uncharacterized protein (TIGR03000 family)
MRYERFVWSLLAAVVLWSSFATPKACAQRFYVLPSYSTGPFIGGPLTQPYTPYTSYYYTYPAAPSYMPYVAPYPAYGVLPPPFVTAHYYEAREQATGKTAEDYGYRLDSQPRMRSSLYPAVPNEKATQDRLTDLRRVRYEIEVPYADAVVYIDGAKTKQKGLKRVYVTPPMSEDRYYTATIKAEWVDQFQKTRQREHTFEFVAGQIIRYEFKE